jgi:hypothetical protein
MKTRNRIAVFAASLGVLAGTLTAGLAGPAAAANPGAGRVEPGRVDLCASGNFPAEFQYLADGRNELLRERVPAGHCETVRVSPKRTSLSIHVNALTNMDPNVGQVKVIGTGHVNPSTGTTEVTLQQTFENPRMTALVVSVAR